ncbi:MAG: hypothetical protein AB8G99_17905 [Planctomycetaceae bacterium]
MTLSAFIQDVFDRGRANVPEPAEIDPEDRNATAEVLVASEAIWRENQPGGLPQFNQEAATWAAEMLYRVAQFQTYRDVNAEFIAAALSEPVPTDPTPSVHYSVDLCFRYLPDLHRLAVLASADDPLLIEIIKLLKPWPLSSVGIEIPNTDVWHPAFQHNSLQRMFIDRIIARQDKRRMKDPKVAAAIRSSLGVHTHLVPAVSADLNNEQTTNND